MESSLGLKLAAALQVGESGRRARKVAKSGLGLLRRRLPLADKTVLFIFGAQRSGTTLLSQIFERDWEAWVYSEKHSRLSREDKKNGVRLDRLDHVARTLDAERHPLLVAKPLVESQNARALLTHFATSRAVWIYRDYRDVAGSALHKFGRDVGIRDVRPIVADDANNWRAENVAPATRALILQNFRDDMDPQDAAGLFWYARNVQFFQNGLDQPDLRDRVFVLPYESLVQNPERTIERLYTFVGRPFPGPDLVSKVHDKSVGKGRSTEMSPPIAMICQNLLDRLDAVAGHARSAELRVGA